MGYFLELMLGSSTAKEIRVYRSGTFFLNKYQQAAGEIFRLARDLRWRGTTSAMAWGSVAAAGIGGAYIYIIYLATLNRIGIGDVARVPQGFETQLGKEFPNGTDLSGGQWQKIALARGFVRDASVIFLDEPTASLDAKTEKAVFEQFLSLAENKTAIVISHRLFITPLVDRIFVLEHARLIEEGSHDQLMERDGVYASMYNTQAGMYWSKNSIAS